MSVCGAVLFNAPAFAQGPAQSQWQINQYSQARLIAAETAVPGKGWPVQLGVEIKLKPGWKTYWRTPGDSGVPPDFSWKGSDNIKSIKILYPAPIRFKDDFGTSIGYKSHVVFPVKIIPRDPAKPIDIKLSFHYAACAQICIPVSAKMNLRRIPGLLAQTRHATVIRQYSEKVPRLVVTKEDAIVVKASLINALKHIIAIDVKPGKSGRDISLFVEGPEQYYFSHPIALIAPGGNIQRYRVKVDGVSEKSSLKNVKLRVTVVEATTSSEQFVTIE